MRTAARAILNGHTVLFTAHAVRQFQARVRPDLSEMGCIPILERAANERGEYRLQAPKGIRAQGLRHRMLLEGWLTFTRQNVGLVCFPLVAHPEGLVATTCITRGPR